VRKNEISLRDSSGGPVYLCTLEQGCGSGSWKPWKRSFCCGSGSAKILPIPLPHRLYDLKSNLAKNFCPFPNVD